MSALSQKWDALPRAAKWLVYLVAVVVAFFAVFEPYLSYLSRATDRADSLEATLRRERDLSDDNSPDGAVIASSYAAFARPIKPGSSRLKPDNFSRVVDGILEFHDVTDRSVTERRVRIPDEQVASLKAGAVDRLILEITFEARPDVVIAILSDLEKAPEVAAVSRIRLDRSSFRDEENQIIRATIAPEAWIPASSSVSPQTPTEVLP